MPLNSFKSIKKYIHNVGSNYPRYPFFFVLLNNKNHQKSGHNHIAISSCCQMFYKIAFLRKFTGKQLYWSLALNEVEDLKYSQNFTLSLKEVSCLSDIADQKRKITNSFRNTTYESKLQSFSCYLRLFDVLPNFRCAIITCVGISLLINF